MDVFSFEDDLEAKQWALDTQKSRRNLSINELCKFALKLRPKMEAMAKEKSYGNGRKPSVQSIHKAARDVCCGQPHA